MPLTDAALIKLLETGGPPIASLLLMVWLVSRVLGQQSRTNDQIIDRLDKLVERTGVRDETMIVALAQQHDVTRERIGEARAEILGAVRGITNVCAVAQQTQKRSKES